MTSEDRFITVKHLLLLDQCFRPELSPEGDLGLIRTQRLQLKMFWSPEHLWDSRQVLLAVWQSVWGGGSWPLRCATCLASGGLASQTKWEPPKRHIKASGQGLGFGLIQPDWHDTGLLPPVSGRTDFKRRKKIPSAKELRSLSGSPLLWSGGEILETRKEWVDAVRFQSQEMERRTGSFLYIGFPSYLDSS